MSTTSTSKINRKLAFLGEAVARTRDPFKNGDVSLDIVATWTAVEL